MGIQNAPKITWAGVIEQEKKQKRGQVPFLEKTDTLGA